jgi:hypothetical protein
MKPTKGTNGTRVFSHKKAQKAQESFFVPLCGEIIFEAK